MTVKISRNHIVIQDEGDTVFLSISGYIRRAIGPGLRLSFRKPGSIVERGSIFGRATGETESCALYAPFDLRVGRPRGQGVEVIRTGDESTQLLDAEEYEDGD